MTALTKTIKRNSDLMPTIIILTIMLFLNISFQKNFFTSNNFQVMARQASPYILIAIAQSLIMLLGGINMGLGSLVSFASCLFATTLAGGINDTFFILGTLLACMALSTLCGLVVYKFKLSPIVVSLAFSFIWGGLALSIMAVPGGYMPSGLTNFLTSMIFGIIPVPMLIIVFFCIIWFKVRKSSLGITIFAVGNNREGAFMSGLNVRKAYIFCYAFSGLLIAAAALMLNAITTSGDPTIGKPLTINAVTAAVIGGVSLSGGKGKILGAVLGGFIVSMLVNVLFYLKISGNYTYIVEGVILVIAVSVNLFKKGRK